MHTFPTSILRALGAVITACTVSLAQAVPMYTIADLGTLGGIFSNGVSVNNSGQVAGRSFTTPGANAPLHAFLYDGTTMNDLGTLGGTNSEGFGINSSGQVAGYSDVTGDTGSHAFLYDGTTMNDLGTLGGTHSFGHAVNDSGQLVGDSQIIAGDTASHAFLWSLADGLLDLNDLVNDLSGWDYLIVARDISETGFITGIGQRSNGTRHAFLLTPVSTAVPTPATLALLSLGIAGLGWSLRKATTR